MKIIKNFYTKSCEDVNTLWYNTGHFFVKAEGGKITQIPRHNTDKRLWDISDEYIKQTDEVGYFILSNAQPSRECSIEYMVKLLGGDGAISTDGYKKAKAEYYANKEALIREKAAREREGIAYHHSWRERERFSDCSATASSRSCI